MGCNGDCESVLFDEVVRSVNLRITFPLIVLIGIWFARRIVDTPILTQFIRQILDRSAHIDIMVNRNLYYLMLLMDLKLVFIFLFDHTVTLLVFRSK